MKDNKYNMSIPTYSSEKHDFTVKTHKIHKEILFHDTSKIHQKNNLENSFTKAICIRNIDLKNKRIKNIVLKTNKYSI